VLERKGVGEPGVIVAVPTQELAVQIGREAERLAKAASLGLKTVVLLGGTPLEKQIAKLKSKPEIVVGTLGRLADLVALGKLRTSSLKLLVLDEADRLFAKETEKLAIALLKSAPAAAPKILVSATVPERLRREMRPLLRDAIEICPVGETVLSGSIEHWCFYCDGRKRLDFARRFEAAVKPARCLLFLSMATRVEKAGAALAAFGLPVGAIHSGMDKETRRVALERFASGELRYLLTSDLGARGLDIQGITHVISLDLPDEPTVYTHRAGRTGRAGATGVSIVLADGVELARASKIAVKGGFVFRCKVLEAGEILEPTSEEFFARANSAEEQRLAAKAANAHDEAHRGLGFDPRRSRGGGAAGREGGDREGGRPSSSPSRSGPARSGPRSGSDRSSWAPRGSPRREASRGSAPGEEIEAPRTATAPRSAPWRPASEAAPEAKRSMLQKKKDIPKPEPAKEAPISRNAEPIRPRVAGRGAAPSPAGHAGDGARRGPPSARSAAPGGSVPRPSAYQGRPERREAPSSHRAPASRPERPARTAPARPTSAPSAPRPSAPRSSDQRPTSPRPSAPRPSATRPSAPRGPRPGDDRPQGATRRVAERKSGPQGEGSRTARPAPRGASPRAGKSGAGKPRSGRSGAGEPRRPPRP
jgi:ATP-dependent RNA helicase DeaD